MVNDPIPQTDWTLVQRYLLGSATPAEADAALGVIAREPRLQALVQALHTPVVGDYPSEETGVLKRRIDAARAESPSSWGWQRTSNDVRTLPAMMSRSGHRTKHFFKTQPLRRNVWYALAGATAAAIALLLGWHFDVKQWEAGRPVVMSTYTTGNGERATVTLPDGGTVSLNVTSRLDVPADYLSGNHTVRLTGEALFTIRHHEGVPLTVLAGRTAARVLGTTFLVRHYAADSGTTIAVREGRVSVHADGVTPLVLAPAQQTFVGRRGGLQVVGADPSLFSFATGVLSLTRIPLPLAIVELDRWYDADIHLADPTLLDQNFTGKCAAGSLADLSEILQATYNVRVVREGRVLTLFPR